MSIKEIMDNYQINRNTFNDLAIQYQDRFMDYDGYLDTFDLLLDILDMEEARILELACGPGNVTKYLLSQKSKLDIYGIDVAPQMIELARKNNPNAKYDVMDCRHVSHITERFDVIICAFGLPYISQEDAVQLISDCKVIINKKGLIYLSTMEGKPEDSEYVESAAHKQKTFVNYYEATLLKKTLIENDFELIHEIRKPYTNASGKEFTDLFLIAQKT